jgi:hypothetical protein
MLYHMIAWMIWPEVPKSDTHAEWRSLNAEEHEQRGGYHDAEDTGRSNRLDEYKRKWLADRARSGWATLR